MDTDSFIAHVKIEFIYKDIVEDVEKRLDISNFEIDRLLHIRKNNKVIGLVKDDLGGQIMKKIVGLQTKTFFSFFLKYAHTQKIKPRYTMYEVNTYINTQNIYQVYTNIPLPAPHYILTICIPIPKSLCFIVADDL